MTKNSEFKVVETPCIGNCCLDTEDICLGCHRHLDEITSWLTVDDKTRQQYYQNMEKRRQMREKQRAERLAKYPEDQRNDRF